jgi:hypothetical protein
VKKLIGLVPLIVSTDNHHLSIILLWHRPSVLARIRIFELGSCRLILHFADHSLPCLMAFLKRELSLQLGLVFVLG